MKDLSDLYLKTIEDQKKQVKELAKALSSFGSTTEEAKRFSNAIKKSRREPIKYYLSKPWKKQYK